MFRYFAYFCCITFMFCSLSNLSAETDVNNISIGKLQSNNEGENLTPDLKVESIVYPKECFLGDTIYHQLRLTNETKNNIRIQIRDLSVISSIDYFYGVIFTISFIAKKNDKYVFIPEIYRHRNKYIAPLTPLIKPDESIADAVPLELPPLEAFAHPFWQKLIDKIDINGIKCELTISIPASRVNHDDDRDHEYVSYKHEILLKPRLSNEQKLLKKWIQDTPLNFLPPVFNGSGRPDSHFWYDEKANAFWKNGYHRSNGNFITVSGEKYNPWNFIRDGNRKPPAQICPTSAEGWLELEKQFQPSTLQDEIKWTRLLLVLLYGFFLTYFV